MWSPAVARPLLLAALLVLPLGACDLLTSSSDPPKAPPGLSASGASVSAIVLSWSENPKGTGRVEIERAQGSESFAPLASVTDGSLEFRDEGLSVATSYRYRIRACNDVGCSPFTAEVEAQTFGPLSVSTETLPSAVRGEAYEAELQASGGDGSYAWLTSGGTLPAGLEVSTAGTVFGTPLEAGAFDVTVEVQSGDGQTVTADPSLIVYLRLQLTTTPLPDARPGRPYNSTLGAEGGDGEYTWALIDGALPAGLALAESGLITGTPEAEETAVFTARVSSGDGQILEKRLVLEVVQGEGDAEVIVDTFLLPPALVGAAYDVDLEARGGDGTDYVWSVAEGSLPTGLDLEASGRLHGTPTAAGTTPLTLEVSSGGATASAAFSLQVAPDATDAYDLTPVPVAQVPPAIQPHVDDAVARWEEVITGDVAREVVPPDFFAGSDCLGFGTVVNGTATDDVLVLVNISSIDGEGNILGFAGPCAIRDNNLTVVGVLTLDQDDLEPMVGTQTLTDLVFHEIGHVLGYGSIWHGLGLVTASGTVDPRFNGNEAVARYESLGGVGNVPLENFGAAGTREVHWRESVFEREVMTGFLNSGTNPLSRVTIASMQDLGYAVDFGAADNFSLSVAGAVASSTAGQSLGFDRVYRWPVRVFPSGEKKRLW